MQTYIASITSQGQLNIPVDVRRLMNLDLPQKATVTVSDNKIIVEPVIDLFSLAGKFHKYAKRGPIDKIIAKEEKAWENAVVEDYRKKFLKNK